MHPDEDFMTIIMGLGDPEKPGQHGPVKMMGMPHESCCELISKIKDMCEEFLVKNAGKDSSENKPQTDGDSFKDKDNMDEEEK